MKKQNESYTPLHISKKSRYWIIKDTNDIFRIESDSYLPPTSGYTEIKCFKIELS